MFEFLETPFTYRLFISFYFKLTDFTVSIYPHLMDSFGNWIRSAIILYIVIVGLMIMYGKVGDKETAQEFGLSLFLIIALHNLVMESSLYSYWIMNPFIDLVFDLSSFFIGIAQDIDQEKALAAGTGLKALFNTLDGISHNIFDLLFKITPPGSFYNNAFLHLQMGFLAACLLIVYVILYACFMIMVFMGVFSMFIYFIVGGPCIFLASFKKTRPIFFAWFKGLVNSGLIIIFASITLAVCVFGLSDSINDLIKAANNGSQWVLMSGPYLGTISWLLLAFALILKAPDYAAQLSGAMAGSTSGIAGAISVGTGGAIVMATKKFMKTGQGNRGGGGGTSGSGSGRSYSEQIGLPENMM